MTTENISKMVNERVKKDVQSKMLRLRKERFRIDGIKLVAIAVKCTVYKSVPKMR